MISPNISSSTIYIAGVQESVWKVAFRDVESGIRKYQLWTFLAWQDIRQRYRRSVLGPFWLTLSTGVMVFMMSILYGRLFNLPLDVYVPFLSAGTIVWTLIASLLNEGCSSFMAADSLIKQVRIPLILHVFRMVWRNCLIFFHNAVILIPVWLIFDKSFSIFALLEVLGALLAIAINGLWIGVLLGALCTRFRDISQIVTNLVQAVFFVTPVMWLPSILEGRGITRWLVTSNPFFHFIEIVRVPLLTNQVPWESWRVVISITLVGIILGMLFLGRFKNRIAYWL